MYTSKDRQNTLDFLTNTIAKLPEVEGIILVGSGADGFTDIWSDIDLTVVCNPSDKTREVWENLTNDITKTYPILIHELNEYGENDYLTIFLLRNWLQIDLGVISFENLVAKRKKWKVLYDRTGIVTVKMITSWDSQKTIDKETILDRSLKGIWYYIQNAVNSFNRKKYLRLQNEISEIRVHSLDLIGIRDEIDVKHFRDVDNLPNEIKSVLLETYPKNFDPQELSHALKSVCDLYFDTALSLGILTEDVKQMQAQMSQYLKETVESVRYRV